MLSPAARCATDKGSLPCPPEGTVSQGGVNVLSLNYSVVF